MKDIGVFIIYVLVIYIFRDSYMQWKYICKFVDFIFYVYCFYFDRIQIIVEWILLLLV